MKKPTRVEPRIAGITPGTARQSIGLEDTDDLIEDVSRALAAAEW